MDVLQSEISEPVTLAIVRDRAVARVVVDDPRDCAASGAPAEDIHIAALAAGMIDRKAYAASLLTQGSPRPTK
jgi:hypothetical protein